MIRKKWILLSFALLCTALIGWLVFELTPYSSDQVQTIKVDKGAGLTSVAEELEEMEIIKNKTFFMLYGKIIGSDNKIKPGKHVISGDLSYSEIYSELVRSPVEKGQEVVIPEGFTVEQIATRLEKKGITSEKAFLKAVKTGEGISHPLIEKVKKHEGTQYKLEGFLFPDTYYLPKDSRPEKVIVKMLNRFQEVKDQFETPKELSLHEWVTLASIVEREAVVAKERPVIAGVFINRLEDQWKLQSCATVQYVLDKPKERLLFKDLKVKSPYNTYLNKGLPPGPISNPGKASLKAVVNAKQHNFYFFVVKGDGTGTHHFSKTFKEHQRYTSHEGNW
ncbi:endolytic transglycosylase MltG [Pseudalkalibacillus decolorationis]|uniref:endolytic transglycosylase MltG n=1 Tax=Pseudalkalibacillus decolorationis TaxID=163879 RepID=UPI0021494543|nr:endolytic transglycosylase MltG [Pseudalkalibacillus decolorationis]